MVTEANLYSRVRLLAPGAHHPAGAEGLLIEVDERRAIVEFVADDRFVEVLLPSEVELIPGAGTQAA